MNACIILVNILQRNSKRGPQYHFCWDLCKAGASFCRRHILLKTAISEPFNSQNLSIPICQQCRCVLYSNTCMAISLLCCIKSSPAPCSYPDIVRRKKRSYPANWHIGTHLWLGRSKRSQPSCAKSVVVVHDRTSLCLYE